MMESAQAKPGISAFTLKMIAIVAMMIDHVACLFLGQYPRLYFIMRTIGKLTMPIMCFFIAEGYHYTRSVPKYLLRLGFFAVLSAYPFQELFGTIMNVMVTLGLGLGVLALCDSKKQKPLLAFCAALSGISIYLLRGNYRIALIMLAIAFVLFLLSISLARTEKFSLWASLLSDGVILVSGMLIAKSLGSDWSYMGVLMVFAFDRLRGRWGILAALFTVMISYWLLEPNWYQGFRWSVFTLPTILPILQYSGYMFGVLLTLPLLALYKGRQGPKLKLLFYTFYPAHLYLLLFIRNFFYR